MPCRGYRHSVFCRFGNQGFARRSIAGGCSRFTLRNRFPVQAGDQIATSENLSPEPFEEQIDWSHNREQYLPLVAEFATLRNRIGNIPLPEPRYGSDLLQRVPADTVLYISVPNLGNFLIQANTIFKDQLNRSPELQQWWSRGGENKTAELDALVDKLHDVSQYLGDEIVIVGVKQANESGFAVIADVQKSGLGDLLKQQFASAGNARWPHRAG